MKLKLSILFLFLTSSLCSQVKYKDFLYNLDSLIKPKLFTYFNTKDNSQTFLLQKTIKVDSGYILIQKRYADSFDIDSTLQFIDNSLTSSIHLENFWFYYLGNIRYACSPDKLEVSKIDYNTPNTHYTKESFKPCDNSIPILYSDKANFKKLQTIRILGKNIECLKYKVVAISTDEFGKKSRRKGFTYLGKNIGVVKFTNNRFFDRTTWVLTEVVDFK